MAGVALLARALGHRVTGADTGIYPPSSTQLAEAGICACLGYAPANLEPTPDLVLIGNALSRGNPEVEAVLDQGLAYTSGAQWIAENVLRDRWAIAIAGTHGKTTTASMVAWILQHAGLTPGFLIGGVPENFGMSARLGDKPFFVIEADEYDTAFFDKRPKFVHYRPRTAVLNNLEFDHADIFADLHAIELQFHYLVRTVAASGRLIVNAEDINLATTLSMGCWTGVEYFGDHGDWSVQAGRDDGSVFRIRRGGQPQGEVHWGLLGRHNMLNGLAAVAAAHHAGVGISDAIEALSEFANVKRRLEIRGTVGRVTVYDDFAHHPTAIAATLRGLRARVGGQRIFAVLELRSNSMRIGVHRDALAGSLREADQVLMLEPAGLEWDLGAVCHSLGDGARMFGNVDEIVGVLAKELRADDHVLVMSNGDFGGLHDRLLANLKGCVEQVNAVG